MGESERRDGERFRDSAAVDRYLDALATGHPPAADGLDPGLAATLDRLHAVRAATHPDPAFVLRLRENLMDYTEPVAVSHGANGVVRDVSDLGVANAPGRLVMWPWRLHRRRARIELATVAILLLTLVAGFTASRLAVEPGGGGRPRGFAFGTPSEQGTSVARTGAVASTTEVATERAADVPGPEECRVAPRSVESLRRLIAEPVVNVSSLRLDAVTARSIGRPADEATVAAVHATARELSACFNAGDELRGMALVTDDFVRRSIATTENRQYWEQEVAQSLATPPAPVADAVRQLPFPVSEVRLLPDGRASAYIPNEDWAALIEVEDGSVWSPDPAISGVLIAFARVGDRWLMDEQTEVMAAGTPSATVPPTVTPVGGGTYAYDGVGIGPDIEVEVVPGIHEGLLVVVTDDGVPMRERPSLASTALTLLQQGAQLEVVGPSVERDGYVWWPVRSWPVRDTQSLQGYVGAGFLEPLNGVQGTTPTVTPSPTARPASVYASGVMKIQEGSIVLVTEDGVNMRPEPSTENEEVSQLQQGAELEVTGPSVEAGEFVWWPVREPLTEQEGYVIEDYLELVDNGIVVVEDAWVPTPFPTALPAEVQVGSTVVSVRDIVLYAAPAWDSTGVASFGRETAFVVIGPRVDDGGGAWWPVQEERSGATGYIMEGFMRLTDAPLARVVVVAPSPTPASAPSPAPAGIDPEMGVFSVQVDLSGLLRGDPQAEEAARAALRDMLKPYLGCRVAVSITYGHAPSVGEGVQLARTINELLSDEFPAVFGETGFRDISSGVEPYGQVEMEMFFYSGCQERHETPAVGNPIEASPAAGTTTGQDAEIAISITATSDIQLLIDADGVRVFDQVLRAGESTGWLRAERFTVVTSDPAATQITGENGQTFFMASAFFELP